MIRVSQYLNESSVIDIRQRLSQLDEAYWQDRSIHKPNLGIKGDVGNYYSCSRTSIPKNIRDDIDALAPSYFPYQLEDWVVNKTPRGGGMPPHVDNEGYFGISLLCLQSDSGCFKWFKDEELNVSEIIADRAGQLIQFDDIRLIHSVPTVVSERYVVVFLYR